MIMKITKQKLIELNACKEGLDRFIEQTGNTEEPVDVSTLIGGGRLNTYSDLLWLAGETLPKDRIVRFACDCALINIELIKPYTDEYDEIVQFLKEPDAVYVYAAAVRAAAVDAAAVDAAAAGGYAAVRAAVRAAAVRAVRAAVRATCATCATDDAAVNNLLIEMFNEV